MEPGTLVLVPVPSAVRKMSPEVFVAAADTDACPLRDACATDALVDVSVPFNLVGPTVAECSRVLVDEGRIEIVVRLRVGTVGFLRALFAWLFRLPAPPRPESVARLLLDHGFHRIEQQVQGGLGRFRARRLPGRR